MSEVLLEAKDVGIRFGGLKALTGFNLEIRRGDLKGLIGPNGAGKTTAFNVLTGVYQPTSGVVLVGGSPVSSGMPTDAAAGEAGTRELSGVQKWLRSGRAGNVVGLLLGLLAVVATINRVQRMGVVGLVLAAVLWAAWMAWRNTLAGTRTKPHQINRLGVARTFQNIRLFKALTALDNVKVACLADSRPVFSNERIERLRKGRLRLLVPVLHAANNYVDWWRALFLTPGFLREEEAITRKAEQLLEVMGLSHRRDEEARNLPYGEQRRLEIARALGTNPKVLLLDEPAAGMNTREKADLMVLIRQLREQFSLGILVIEHDMKLVMGICEDITVLDHGEVIARGTPEQVRSNRKVIEAYLGDSYLESHEPPQGPPGTGVDGAEVKR
ncbi:MAG TPA: ABC transporter ATP-binding protein [Myxococcaceae bacterium]|nr:ABC transporter ATP-binding protein [Myxococcaceae bacterium]